MRAIVCGGRNYNDADCVFRVLDGLGLSAVAQGGCPTGADSHARAWARHRGVRMTDYIAMWDAHGRAAGPLRNAIMLQDFAPDLVVCFPGGRGTADMRRRAEAAGVRVLSVDIGGDRVERGPQ